MITVQPHRHGKLWTLNHDDDDDDDDDDDEQHMLHGYTNYFIVKFRPFLIVNTFCYFIYGTASLLLEIFDQQISRWDNQ